MRRTESPLYLEYLPRRKPRHSQQFRQSNIQTDEPRCHLVQMTVRRNVSRPAQTGRILTPPPERRIYPAAPVPLARLPDESGVPVGVATRLGGGAEMRPVVPPSR